MIKRYLRLLREPRLQNPAWGGRIFCVESYDEKHMARYLQKNGVFRLVKKKTVNGLYLEIYALNEFKSQTL